MTRSYNKVLDVREGVSYGNMDTVYHDWCLFTALSPEEKDNLAKLSKKLKMEIKLPSY